MRASLPETIPPVMLLGGGEQSVERDYTLRELVPLAQHLGVPLLSESVRQDAKFSEVKIDPRDELLLQLAWPMVQERDMNISLL